MYKIRPTSKFRKDLKRIQKRGYDLTLLTDIINKLTEGKPLPEKNKDHPLSGNYKECRNRVESALTGTPSHTTMLNQC